ncbi:transcriptional regulator, LysR family [Roseibium hamelinense]|uniref:Transcriptional regulator, LysR family n=1 Tax=Roseibium hamelinense TaxID=150831 RepID=A0A562TG47_9HYPH|nr:LysR family transcriptional regulator [Roseibium hamelinense]MTI43122.1 LysR family transcriptional regulator [Roseibium hamelinense]TWI92531.1 transcriptional regulator, LysR family [Roseibium hamelinense]
MLRINLDQLRTFLIVVRSGGVVKAAQSLNLTQPAVTARMKNLEQTLGTQLFDRSAGHNRLTKKGELLLQYALKLEVLSNQIERDIVDPAHLEGHLRLGASETIAQSWMPDFITELSRRFPKLQIEFNVDVSVNLRNALLAREIDLAFLLGPVSEFSVDNIALPEFELGWYASVNVPDDRSEAAGLFGKPVITYAKNTRPYRELRDKVQEKAGADVPLFPSSSLSAAIRLVESGLGVGALPRVLAQPYVQAGTLKTFDPGWGPEPLTFTASFIADPRSQMVESAALLAAEIASQHV